MAFASFDSKRFYGFFVISMCLPVRSVKTSEKIAQLSIFFGDSVRVLGQHWSFGLLHLGSPISAILLIDGHAIANASTPKNAEDAVFVNFMKYKDSSSQLSVHQTHTLTTSDANLLPGARSRTGRTGPTRPPI